MARKNEISGRIKGEIVEIMYFNEYCYGTVLNFTATGKLIDRL